MRRFFAVIAVVTIAAASTQAHAQNSRHQTHGHAHKHQRSAPPSLFGFTLGAANAGNYAAQNSPGYSSFGGMNPSGVPFYGYGYYNDPYQFGSFRAPDLMRDPYFKAEHKFDSRFPGRYAR